MQFCHLLQLESVGGMMVLLLAMLSKWMMVRLLRKDSFCPQRLSLPIW